MQDGIYDMAVNMGQYFVKNKLTNILDIVINLFDSAKKASANENEVKTKFFNMLNLVNKDPFMLGGGKSQKEAFKKFVEGYLSIVYKFKNEECCNIDFARLTTDEMIYVLCWANRYVKCFGHDKRPS
ncbi:hypothetical protein JJQ93_09450 [Thermoanaerobacterium sp. R66]|nr:hypothetical protein [Thermoanaerobacterium sp. R66]